MRWNLTATIFILIYILNIFIKNPRNIIFQKHGKNFDLFFIQYSDFCCKKKKIHKWAQIDNGFSN